MGGRFMTNLPNGQKAVVSAYVSTNNTDFEVKWQVNIEIATFDSR
jgi:hypothetical protein